MRNGRNLGYMGYKSLSVFFLWLLLLVLPLVLLVGVSLAQNYSNLDWRVIQTPHFNVFYHQGEEEISGLAAAIAEEIYEPITSLYGFRPDGKVHIVLKDCGDYSNGAAYYYENKIEIWITGLDFELRGTHDWLRDVITHEFTHIVSLQLARKGPRWIPGFYIQGFSYQKEEREDILTRFPNVVASYLIPGTVVPMWIAEGAAQYQADGARFDRWDSHRDMILRMATLDGKLLSYEEMGVFAKNGLGNEMVYNQGYSLVRFIADSFGNDKLRAIFRRLSAPLTFDFSSALSQVLGISGPELYRLWKDHLTTKYTVQAEAVMENRIEGEPLEQRGYLNAYPVWSPDGSRIAYLSNRGQDYHIAALYILNLKDKTTLMVTGGVVSSPSWSPDGEKLVYTKKSRPDRYGARFWDIYEYDLKAQKERRLTFGLRAKFPDYSPDGTRIVFVKNSAGTNNLGLIKSDGSFIGYLTDFADRTQIYTPRWSPDGTRIAFSILRGESRDIALIRSDGSGLRYLVSSTGSERDPCWTPDGKEIIFTSDVSGIFNLYSISLVNEQVQQLTNVLGGAFSPSISPSDGRIAFSSYTSEGYQLQLLLPPYGWREVDGELFRQPVDPSGVKGDGNRAPADSHPYRTMFLGFQVMPRVALDANRTKAGFYLTSSDVLNKQSIIGGLLFADNFDLDLFTIIEYKQLIPTLFFEYYKVMRHLKEDVTDPDNLYRIDRTDFDLNEVWLGVRYRLWGTHEFSLSAVYSLYNTDLKGVSLTSRQRFTFSYTYYKGLDLAFIYNYRNIKRMRDGEINPQGREVLFRYDRMFDYLIKGFKPSFIVREVYRRYNYDRFILDWREYIPMPWKRDTLGLRFKVGLIDRRVDDFLDFHLGGKNGMRGYTYWSLEGRKIVMGSITYRFPFFGSLRRKLFHLYVDKVYGAVFAGMGRAWDSDSIDFKTEGFKRDIGAQLRLDLISFYSYPTKVELDVAYGLDEGKGRDPVKLYLTVLFGYN
ncbi:MAG TPA: hypothetical protein EYP53_08995 [Candidatus Latescibacteria bacterium]|nr:hypothetical protein [Candidatus Latescibacterota bacterium]